MKWILFYHSLLSDWNHGNAHFLRGVVNELRRRGHSVTVMVPQDGWSQRNLVDEYGTRPLKEVETSLGLENVALEYGADIDLSAVLEDADVVIAHEWSSPELIARLGRYRQVNPSLRLLFHDTHHRAVSEPEAMRAYDLSHYDGVLVFGRALQEIYLARSWAQHVWIWHEAADVAWFNPRAESAELREDLVWIGNWGDNERSDELRQFLFEPVRQLRLSGRVHGVRYPPQALQELKRAGLKYGGWLPNHKAPEVYARHALTVHVPRRFYREALPGIPTIRIFEALACGIPLICSPWEDTEQLFTPGEDFLMVETGNEMRDALHAVLTDPDLGARLRRNGLRTIQRRHSCFHRVLELEKIIAGLRPDRTETAVDDSPLQPAVQ